MLLAGIGDPYDLVTLRRRRLLVPQRRARKARSLVLVPAFVAGALATGHAEVEGAVEFLGDPRGLVLGDVDARRGHGLVHRGSIGHDEVLEALRKEAGARQSRGPGGGRGGGGIEAS